MKKLLLILLCLPIIGFGQIWEKTYGGNSRDDGYFVQQTTDGGYIMCGKTNSFGNGGYDVYLIKTDLNGVEEWSQTYGGINNDEAYTVQQTTDSGYIMCGKTNSFGNGGDDVYIIKTDLNGVEEWTQTYGGTGGESSNDIKQTSDGGYIICGQIFNVSWDAYVIKIDLNGIVEWTQNYGGANSTYAKSVEQTSDGGYIICGQSGTNVYLIKTDLNGVEEWSQTYSGSLVGNCIKQTTDGGYIILADAEVGNNYEIQLIKTDLNGVEEWSQVYGGGGLQQSNYVQQTLDGGYIVLGSTDNPNGILFFKVNSNGIEEWSKQFSGGYPGSCQQTLDGGFIICGTNEDAFPDTDLYLIKTDGQGTSNINITSLSNRKLDILINVLGMEINNKKYQPLLYIYDDGTVEKKIVIE